MFAGMGDEGGGRTLESTIITKYKRTSVRCQKKGVVIYSNNFSTTFFM